MYAANTLWPVAVKPGAAALLGEGAARGEGASSLLLGQLAVSLMPLCCTRKEGFKGKKTWDGRLYGDIP